MTLRAAALMLLSSTAFAAPALNTLKQMGADATVPAIEKVAAVSSPKGTSNSPHIDASWHKRFEDAGLPPQRLITDIRTLRGQDAIRLLTVTKGFVKIPNEHQAYALQFFSGKLGQKVQFGAGWIYLYTTTDDRTYQAITMYGSGQIVNTGVAPVDNTPPEQCRVINPEFCR
ncbi:MAG: hypothetical protein HY078_07590 [Elusimicrobia bacterium]|nr:hypothetical protein [Elusimicrobiota bacterium]